MAKVAPLAAVVALAPMLESSAGQVEGGRTGWGTLPPSPFFRFVVQESSVWPGFVQVPVAPPVRHRIPPESLAGVEGELDDSAPMELSF